MIGWLDSVNFDVYWNSSGLLGQDASVIKALHLTRVYLILLMVICSSGSAGLIVMGVYYD